MMNTYIVLLRGINVGGKNVIPMKELVKILAKNNFQHINTYIRSGNIVLQSEGKPHHIASLIQAKYGFEPSVYVLELSELQTALANNPYRSPKGKDIHFYFCQHPPKPDTEKLKRYKSETEAYHLDGKVFYLYAPEGIGRSKLVANIESCLGTAATGRNLNTMVKLQKMAQNN
jgi:uncharacterized protein (DUF1697 family)